MEVYKLENEIATLKFSGTDLYAGTYHYENERRIGAIYKNNIQILATTGTFEIDTKEGVLFAANSENVTKICEKTTINNTKHMNTSIHASDMITVTSSIGAVLLYDDKLQLQKEITLCKGHIIWIAKKYENLLVAGCDCGKLFFYDLRNDTYKCHKRESGITSVYMKNGKIIVGAYDGKLIVYDDHFEVESEHVLGNVWRIIDVEENMGLSCMYDGVKILDNAFNVINSYTTKNIAYGIDYCNKKLVFSDFYEKTYYQVDYGNTD